MQYQCEPNVVTAARVELVMLAMSAAAAARVKLVMLAMSAAILLALNCRAIILSIPHPYFTAAPSGNCFTSTLLYLQFGVGTFNLRSQCWHSSRRTRSVIQVSSLWERVPGRPPPPGCRQFVFHRIRYHC